MCYQILNVEYYMKIIDSVYLTAAHLWIMLETFVSQLEMKSTGD